MITSKTVKFDDSSIEDAAVSEQWNELHKIQQQSYGTINFATQVGNTWRVKDA